MAINKDGAAHYRRAVSLAQREIEAEPVLWSSRYATITAMVAWLLTRAGASDEELGAWMQATPKIAARLASEFDARLAIGDELAMRARRRMEALAERMGVIVVAGDDHGKHHMCEIIPFPRAHRAHVGLEGAV
jgi:hypothetical protein